MESEMSHHLDLICNVLEATELENAALKGKVSQLEQQLSQHKLGIVTPQTVPSFFKNLQRSEGLFVDSSGLVISTKG
jgi:hypothetical protein